MDNVMKQGEDFAIFIDATFSSDGNVLLPTHPRSVKEIDVHKDHLTYVYGKKVVLVNAKARIYYRDDTDSTLTATNADDLEKRVLNDFDLYSPYPSMNNLRDELLRMDCEESPLGDGSLVMPLGSDMYTTINMSEDVNRFVIVLDNPHKKTPLRVVMDKSEPKPCDRRLSGECYDYIEHWTFCGGFNEIARCVQNYLIFNESDIIVNRGVDQNYRTSLEGLKIANYPDRHSTAPRMRPRPEAEKRMQYTQRTSSPETDMFDMDHVSEIAEHMIYVDAIVQ